MEWNSDTGLRKRWRQSDGGPGPGEDSGQASATPTTDEQKKSPRKSGAFLQKELDRDYGLVGSGASPGLTSVGVDALAATGLAFSAP